MPNTTSLLANLPLLAGLTETDTRDLASHTRVDYYAREAIIFNQGDPCDRLWLLAEGRVKIVHQSEAGRDAILEVVSPGEAFGGAAFFLQTHPATARAMTEVETISFPSDVYERMFRANPEFALHLTRMLGVRLHTLMSLQALTGDRVERRVAHILLKLAKRAGRPEPLGGILITLPFSRQDLADMTGTTLETAIRTLSHFREQGWVETRRGGYILIRDLEQMRSQAGS